MFLRDKVDISYSKNELEDENNHSEL